MNTPEKHDIERLTKWLADNPGWIKSATITEWLGYDKRQTRAIAEHSDGLILSWPGSPGYCHIEHSTADERQHFHDATCSQIRKMQSRMREVMKSEAKLYQIQ
jgi:hypothetical protein